MEENKMKKYFMTVCAAVALLSCAKEINTPITTEGPANLEEQEIQPLVFDFQINHASMDDTATKAVKSGWEAGDVVYVFFSGIAAPKHVELTYDGTAWTSKQITTGKTEGSIGLTTDGTMTAVYLPFGNDSVVETKSGRFGFDQTIYSYYLSCVNAPYTISGDVVSGTLDMNVPDGFVQFFYTDSEATDEGALLREAHITPKAVTGVNTDGTLVIESKDSGAQMPGYVYGTGVAKGYLFSGELADAARGVSTDYHFNMVVGATSKVLEGTKTLHSGTVGNYAHRAIKFPALSSWSDGSDEIIEFADANIKAKVVTAFDDNGDGELSYAEAAAATSISGVFGSVKTYTSFDEFQYFTSITQIPGEMFMGWTLLESIMLPNSIARIKYYAFHECRRLRKISIPDTVNNIEYYAFRYCSSLKEFIFPDGISSISNGVLGDCTGLEYVYIPNGVSSIEDYAFNGCTNLISADIPNSVQSIGSSAFYGCGHLSSVNIPVGVTTLNPYSFCNCTSITTVYIPDGVTSVAGSTFYGCSGLTSVSLPDGLVNIGGAAFYDCSSLESVVIPDDVLNIGTQAFLNCSSLSSITVLAENVPSGGNNMFNNTNNCPIYVPAGSVDDYKAAQYWSDYAERILAKPAGIPTAVDLGLSVKWASFNLGASAPEEYGDYFAWGEIEPYYEEGYSQSASPVWKEGKSAGYSNQYESYKWWNSSDKFTKYNNDSNYGFTDNLTVLERGEKPGETIDDSARAILGGKWRMPTDSEWTELRELCTWTWTDDYNGTGVSGRIVTGTNGNSIFLPAAGVWEGSAFAASGSYGVYWSSSLYTEHAYYAWLNSFHSSLECYRGYEDRCYGFSVRPVSE